MKRGEVIANHIEGKTGKEVDWRGHRINIDGAYEDELRIVEINAETELTQIPAEMWQGVLFLDKKLGYKRTEERDYLIIDTPTSSKYLRVEDVSGRLHIFKGDKIEKDCGPCYEDQTSCFTVVAGRERISVYYQTESGDFSLFGGTPRGKLK